MPILYENKKLTPAFTASIPKKENKPNSVESQAQYLSRIKAMKVASVGTGIRTGMPPPTTLSKPEVEELESR